MLDSSEIPSKEGLHKVSTVSSCGVRRGRGRKYQDWRLVAPAKHLLCIVCGNLALLAYSPHSPDYPHSPHSADYPREIQHCSGEGGRGLRSETLQLATMKTNIELGPSSFQFYTNNPISMTGQSREII